MKKNKTLLMLVLGLSLSLFVVVPALGGYYIEMKVETKGMPQGLPEGIPQEMLDMMKQDKTEITKTYLTENYLKNESPDSSMILDFNNLKAYQIDPSTKTYTIHDLKQLSEQMGAMAGSDMKINIRSTDEKKEIAGYDSRKYIQETAMGESVVWASKEVPHYSRIKDLYRKISDKLGEVPFFQQMNMAGQMDKMEGWPVKSISNIMGVNTVSTLHKIEEKKFSDDQFQVPEGYTEQKVDYPSQMGGQTGEMPKMPPVPKQE